ncbi:hypothetical protein AAFF_G00262970 [Aldrovandia affinis]|uniref:Uncharacterized protein n=1 Tax=Aldrovandia affinis TaxID=143900 RepID=A0AAD7SSJ6_9TELE|nr:hypothetical protein AAFF_G00262970 [Aldrovandia affinis]
MEDVPEQFQLKRVPAVSILLACRRAPSRESYKTIHQNRSINIFPVAFGLAEGEREQLAQKSASRLVALGFHYSSFPASYSSGGVADYQLCATHLTWCRHLKQRPAVRVLPRRPKGGDF